MVFAGLGIEKINGRRFGPGQEKPCRNPAVLLCARDECCRAGVCQWPKPSDEEKEAG